MNVCECVLAIEKLEDFICFLVSAAVEEPFLADNAENFLE